MIHDPISTGPHRNVRSFYIPIFQIYIFEEDD